MIPKEHLKKDMCRTARLRVRGEAAPRCQTLRVCHGLWTRALKAKSTHLRLLSMKTEHEKMQAAQNRFQNSMLNCCKASELEPIERKSSQLFNSELRVSIRSPSHWKALPAIRSAKVKAALLCKRHDLQPFLV